MVLCLSCAACGKEAVPADPVDTPSTKGGSRDLQLNPTADPDSGGTVRYSANLSSSQLPSPAPTTKVTRDAAIAIAKRGQNFGSEMQPGNPVAALRLLTLSVGPAALPRTTRAFHRRGDESGPGLRDPVARSGEPWQPRCRASRPTDC